MTQKKINTMMYRQFIKLATGCADSKDEQKRRSKV